MWLPHGSHRKKYMNTFCAISTSYISIFYYRCSAVIHTYFFVFIALVTLSSACCISRFSVYYEFAELPNAGDATMWTMARGRALRFSSFLFIAFYHYVFFSSVCLYPSQCECMELLLCHVTNSFSFCFSFFWPFLLFSHAQLLFFRVCIPMAFCNHCQWGMFICRKLQYGLGKQCHCWSAE